MSQRKPGHHQGIPRYRREGQTTMDVVGQLHPAVHGALPDFEAIAACDLCKSFCTGACDDDEDDLAFVGTCQSCGAYWDVRQYKHCPSPCNGYIG